MIMADFRSPPLFIIIKYVSIIAYKKNSVNTRNIIIFRIYPNCKNIYSISFKLLFCLRSDLCNSLILLFPIDYTIG